jgi:hypothetical protein
MQLAPNSQKINTGYDVNAVKKVSPGGRNAFLTLGKDDIGLWVYEVQTAFALGGGTVQSYRTRTYFARNFVQPKFTIMAQAPNQEEYARVVEFIHKAQHEALNNVTTKLQIIGGGLRNTAPRMKGVRRPIQALGYISSIQRRHERFLNAPEFQFEFIVSEMQLPKAWADDPVQIRKLKTWQEILDGILTENGGAGFVDNPDTPATGPDPDALPPNLADMVQDLVGGFF